VIDDMFIFDNVLHVMDFGDENLRRKQPDARAARDGAVHLNAALRWPDDARYGDHAFWAKRWTPEDLYDLVFERAPVDMAMAQTVPVFDWFEHGYAPVEAQHAMAAAYPERVLFCGGVDPVFHGIDGALRETERQITELGACSMKFYNAALEGAWRCDDRELAYPLYEKAAELGVTVLQFHKGIPFGKWNVEHVRPNDLQAPARDFPELTFVIHHLGIPYVDETLSIAGRFPNVHLALSGILAFSRVAPRRVQEWMGRLLMEVGAEKLLWGSEAAATGSPAAFLDSFLELQIDDDLCEGYGYPKITAQDRRLILGENFARMMAVDVAAKRRELDGLPVGR
jgi:uncharacterized protein